MWVVTRVGSAAPFDYRLQGVCHRARPPMASLAFFKRRGRTNHIGPTRRSLHSLTSPPLLTPPSVHRIPPICWRYLFVGGRGKQW